MFVLDPAWYVDAFSTLPGVNVWLRLVPVDRLNQVTQITLNPVHWTTDVGVTGDNVSTNHVPGLSVYPNSEWAAPSTVDGRTVGGDQLSQGHLILQFSPQRGTFSISRAARFL